MYEDWTLAHFDQRTFYLSMCNNTYSNGKNIHIKLKLLQFNFQALDKDQNRKRHVSLK